MLKPIKTKENSEKIFTILGRMYSFMISLKLAHWNAIGNGSYAKHMALDQAIEELEDVLDSLVETTFANGISINIVVPESKLPEDVIELCKRAYTFIDSHRKDFTEIFTQSIIDEWQQANKALQYRLIRLS